VVVTVTSVVQELVLQALVEEELSTG